MDIAYRQILAGLVGKRFGRIFIVAAAVLLFVRLHSLKIESEQTQIFVEGSRILLFFIDEHPEIGRGESGINDCHLRRYLRRISHFSFPVHFKNAVAITKMNGQFLSFDAFATAVLGKTEISEYRWLGERIANREFVTILPDRNFVEWLIKI